MEFPVFVEIGSLRLHPHLVFESLAYAAGLGIYFRSLVRKGSLTNAPDWNTQAWLIAAAVFGALVGAVLVGSLDVSSQGIQVGKSLVGGVIGGWVGVVIGKKILGIERSTGDNWVVPLCVGIAIGRLGCFFTGLADQTYGVATILPWGVDFGDGVFRHPTQLYEALFVACITPFFVSHLRSSSVPGRSFRLFVLVYAGWRLLAEDLKPTSKIIVGLSFIQAVCLAVVVVVGVQLQRSLRAGHKMNP